MIASSEMLERSEKCYAVELKLRGHQTFTSEEQFLSIFSLGES